jgi:hypothetical protein
MKELSSCIALGFPIYTPTMTVNCKIVIEITISEWRLAFSFCSTKILIFLPSACFYSSYFLLGFLGGINDLNCSHFLKLFFGEFLLDKNKKFP